MYKIIYLYGSRGFERKLSHATNGPEQEARKPQNIIMYNIILCRNEMNND